MEIKNKSTKSIVKEFGKNEKDSGNVKVQIAILTKEILILSEHLRNNKKDKHSRLGLYKKISHRKKLLSYFKNKDQDAYQKLILKLGIRK